MKKMILVLGALGAVAMANAVVFETEPNNTVATADSFMRSTSAPFADLAVASLAPGDVDFYSIMLFSGESLNLSVTQVPVNPATFDSYLGLFDGAGNLIEADDDDGPGLISSITYDVLTSGTYFIGVTGFGDVNFDGIGHSESANYFLTASAVPVPEPATMTALGLGVAAVIRRRKKK